MQRRTATSTMAAVFVLLSAQLNAQENTDSSKAKQLKEVVISATRSEKNLNEIGRSITVITSENIQKSGSNSVSELLNSMEGCYVVGAQQNPGSLNTAFLRGANSNHTVILIDGFRITDPSGTDRSIDLSELSTASIDKIEVVRGSHSTLYGSSAIGGVINIITKKNSGKSGFHVDASVNGGIFNENGSLHTENLFLNYTDRSGLYVNGEIFNLVSKGFNSTVDTITKPNAYKHKDTGDDFSKMDLIGKLGYRNGKLDLFAGYKIIDQKNNIDDGAFKDDDNYTLDMKRNLLTYGAGYKLNNMFSFQFNGGITDNNREFVDDSSIVSATGTTDHSYWSGAYKGRSANNELQFNFRIKGFEGAAGGYYEGESMTFKTRYYSTAWGIYESTLDLDTIDIHTSTGGGFLHGDINGILINEKFKPYSLALGTRYVNHSLFGMALTYEINPSFKLTDNSLLYFSYTTGFNAPSLYQLYAPNKDFISGITRGNKTLKPEESKSFEIGFKQKIGDDFSWSVSAFKTVIDNSIDYVYLWDKNIGIDTLGNDWMRNDYRGDTYINLGKQANKGLEFSVSSQLSEKWIIGGNFSLVYGNLVYNPSTIDASHTHGNHVQLYNNGVFLTKETKSLGLVRRPNTANLNLTFIPIKKLALRFDTRFVGSRSDIFYDGSLGPYGALNTIGMEDYTLIDFSVRFEIIKGLTAMIKIENVFDTKYYEIKGYATRGRGIYCGIRYNF